MFLFGSFLLFTELLFQYSAITGMVGDNLINLPPIRQTADTSVVNEPVGFELAGEVIVVLQTLFRIILIYSPEFNSSFSTPFYCLVQEFSFAYNYTGSGSSVSYQVFLNGKDHKFKCKFKEKKRTLTLTANPTSGGTVTGGGTYKVKTNIPITAVAKSGYTFSGWTVTKGDAKIMNASSARPRPRPDRPSIPAARARRRRVP